MQLKPEKDLPKIAYLFSKKSHIIGGLFLSGLILGGVSAIALPSLLSCTNKAKQAEARQNVGAMNRAQQAYFLEKNNFSNSLSSLGVGIKPQTENYQYLPRATANQAFNYGISRKGTPNSKSYVGAVFAVKQKDEIITLAILCEATSPGIFKPADPIYENGAIACGNNTKDIFR